jgi:hypothetical protein
MDRLEAEMRFYHNCFTLAKCYHLDDDTAANEAKGCLNFYVQQCEQGHDPKDVAGTIYEEFDEYLKSW